MIPLPYCAYSVVWAKIGEEFVHGEGEGGAHIDFDQGLAAGVDGAQGNVAVPRRGEFAEVSGREAWVISPRSI